MSRTDLGINRILSYFEDDFDLRRLNEDLTNYVNLNKINGETYLPLSELDHDNENFCTIPYAIALNRKSIHEQNKRLFSKNYIIRRALPLYMLGCFSFRHADTLLGIRHKFTSTPLINDYDMARKFAAFLEGWVKPLFGSPLVISDEPSWFMEDTKNPFVFPSKLQRDSFLYGYINHNNEYRVGFSVENHFDHMIQLSVTVNARHATSNYYWRRFLYEFAQEHLNHKKIKPFKCIFTTSLPFLAQHYKIFRIIFYKPGVRSILPMVYQRIFSSRTEELVIISQSSPEQLFHDPLQNWGGIISELKR